MRLYYDHWPCFLWLSSSTFLVLTLAATIPLPNSPNGTLIPSVSRLSTATINQAPSLNADTGLAINPVFNGPRLDQTSLLISAVQLLAKEALEDINSEVPQTSYRSTDPRYCSVGILVLPPSNAATLHRRLLIWGLAESLLFLMQRNRFASAKFRMTLYGTNVGSVEYRFLINNDQLPLPANNAKLPRVETPVEPLVAGSKNITQGVANGPTHERPTNNTLAANDAGLKVYCRLTGYDLEPADVFRPVIDLLRNMANLSPQSRIQEFKTPFTVGETALDFRARAPYFSAEAIIKAAAAVPAYMLNKGRFSEVEIRVEMVDVLIAKGELKIQRSPRPGSQPVGSIDVY
ncbi:MAG: hypothetical protein Q9191_002121 [Dirinaria sp. TL-2023a]